MGSSLIGVVSSVSDNGNLMVRSALLRAFSNHGLRGHPRATATPLSRETHRCAMLLRACKCIGTLILQEPRPLARRLEGWRKAQEFSAIDAQRLRRCRGRRA